MTVLNIDIETEIETNTENTETTPPRDPVQPEGEFTMPPVESPVDAVMSLLDIDPDHLMLDGIDTSAKPLFTVSEMATVFFARSSHWIRWLETCQYPVPDAAKPKKRDPATRKMVPATKNCGIHPEAHTRRMKALHEHTWRLVLDGELLTPLRTSSNARKYDLALIEKMAHALADNGTIQGVQFLRALILIRTLAEMNGYLPDQFAPVVEPIEEPEPTDQPTERNETDDPASP